MTAGSTRGKNSVLAALARADHDAAVLLRRSRRAAAAAETVAVAERDHRARVSDKTRLLVRQERCGEPEVRELGAIVERRRALGLDLRS